MTERLDCRTVQDRIAELLGGEAGTEARADLLTHVESCTACARSFAGLEEILLETRASIVPEPPEAYFAGFLPELRSRLERDRSWHRADTIWRRAERGFGGLVAWPRTLGFGRATFLRPALAAATLVALVVAGLRPIPSVLPPGPDSLASADLERARGLTRALDTIGSDDDVLALEEMAALGSVGAAAASLPSADVFGFMDSADPIPADQIPALVAALEEEFRG